MSTPNFKIPGLSFLSENLIKIVCIHPRPEFMLHNDDSFTKQGFEKLPEEWLPTQHGGSGPAWPWSPVWGSWTWRASKERSRGSDIYVSHFEGNENNTILPEFTKHLSIVFVCVFI